MDRWSAQTTVQTLEMSHTCSPSASPYSSSYSCYLSGLTCREERLSSSVIVTPVVRLFVQGPSINHISISIHPLLASAGVIGDTKSLVFPSAAIVVQPYPLNSHLSSETFSLHQLVKPAIKHGRTRQERVKKSAMSEIRDLRIHTTCAVLLALFGTNSGSGRHPLLSHIYASYNLQPGRNGWPRQKVPGASNPHARLVYHSPIYAKNLFSVHFASPVQVWICNNIIRYSAFVRVWVSHSFIG